MPPKNVSPTLQGYRIALTIDADDPLPLAAKLRELEADVLFYPVAQLLPPDSFDELDVALQLCQQGEISWLLLTTPCAVEAVSERLAHLQLTPADLRLTKIATFGAKTRLSVAAHFPTWQDNLPHFDTHQQVIEAMYLGASDTVLLPQSMHSRADWSSLVEATPAKLITVPAYRLLLGRGGDDLPGLLWGGLVDAVVFLTENSVRHFAIRLKVEGGSLDMLDHVVVACLDPQTAAAAQVFDLRVQVLPAEYTPDALAYALAEYISVKAVEM